MVDDFRVHHKEEVKDFVKSKKSGNDTMPEKDRYELCQFEIMAGGITPKAQPLDAFIGKIFKGYYREYYDEYYLQAPVKEDTGEIKPPS